MVRLNRCVAHYIISTDKTDGFESALFAQHSPVVLKTADQTERTALRIDCLRIFAATLPTRDTMSVFAVCADCFG